MDSGGRGEIRLKVPLSRVVNSGMLLVTLALVLATLMVGALVYAIRTAAEGREDDSGFHYAGANPVAQLANLATPPRVPARIRREGAAARVVIHSHPTA